MINGYLEGTPEEKRAVSLARLSDPNTAPRLAALGVRYVLLESAPPGYGQPPPGTPGKGLRLLYREPYGSIYLVTAKPSGPALAAPAAGFGADEPVPAGTENWLEASHGTIELAGRCTACSGVLKMVIASFARPRTVEISAGGRQLARVKVVAPTQVAVPLAFRRQGHVQISVSPGPQSIAKTIGLHDPRSVSVQVGQLEFLSGASGKPEAHA
jgi:hypothetical protein